jgi:tetratricopeptide (TPR) repeat protein/uncharacterized RDD family membrane protein YckC
MIDVLFLFILFTIFGPLGRAFISEANQWILELLETGIFILYFGLFNSHHGKGQTIGKRLTKIKVVGQHGKNISFSMSCLRASILFIVFAAGTPAFLENIQPFKLINLVGIGAAGAAIYLYIFNSRTRQSLHDLAVGTCVVSTQHSGKVDLPKVRKVHYTIAFVLAAALIVINQGVQIFQEAFLPKFESRLESLQPMQEKIYKIDMVKEVVINEEMVKNKRNLQVIVIWEERPEDLEKAGIEIAAIILKEDPDVASLDNLIVSFREISRVKFLSLQYETFKDYYAAKHSPEEWKKILESTILRSTLSLEIKETDPDELLNQGITFANQGQYDQAIAYFDKAIEINPKLVLAYNNRGIAYKEKGQFDQAISDYNKALEINPGYAPAYINRGVAYAEKQKYDEAIADYTEGIQINPRVAGAYLNRGLAYAQGKDEHEEAISDFTKAIEINPKFADAYHNRAVSYFYKSDYEKAWDDVHKAESLGRQAHPKFLKMLREVSGRQK